MLISFSSFFSFFIMKAGTQRVLSGIEYEINENNEKSPRNEQGFISLISLNSFFSLFVNI